MRSVLFGVIVLAALGGCESLVTDPVPYGTIRVRAIGRDSLPLPGIAVELYTGFAPHGYHTTDANGRTTFSRVPMQQYGVLMKPGTQYGLLQDILPETTQVVVSGINVTASTDTTFTFVFTRRGPGAIEAHVVDQTNSPVVGAKVGLYNFAGEISTLLTNLGGIARFESVPYGNWGIYVDTPDSLGAGNINRQTADGLAIELGTEIVRTFSVNQCVGSIAVTVLDQADAPVAGYPLQLYTFAGAYRYLSTAANGIATFTKVPCGNYGVIAEPNAGFSVDYTRGNGFQDGLGVAYGSALSPTLRVTRN